eukprot:1157385-Pelagomonas_calceolata.AAC.1
MKLKLEKCLLGHTYAGSMQKTGNFRPQLSSSEKILDNGASKGILAQHMMIFKTCSWSVKWSQGGAVSLLWVI